MEVFIMENTSNAIGRIEGGIFDLIRVTGPDNESLINRAEILQSIQTLIRTIQLSTQRRLTSKLSADPEATIDKAFEKFSVECRGATK
jgi:hypothetical protein